MSARRLAIIAAVVLVVGGVGWLLLRPEPPPAPTAKAPQAQGRVLLVPGYGGGTVEVDGLARRLNAQGLATQVVDIDDGTGDLRDYAGRVAQEAQDAAAAGEPPPDVVGFSAGGVIARIAATGDPGAFRRVVTLASPHAGTATAELGAMFAECPTACQQLRPDSAVLKALPEPPYPLEWLSVWSDTDLVIRPAVSSVIDGVADYRLQQACAAPVGHADVPNHPQTVAVVVAFLQGQSLPQRCVPG